MLLKGYQEGVVECLDIQVALLLIFPFRESCQLVLLRELISRPFCDFLFLTLLFHFLRSWLRFLRSFRSQAT